jgi:aminoglycoside phosphotransferase (APT) family kinase protein
MSTDRAPTDGPPGLPVAALDRHLRQALPGLLQGPLSAQLVAGGRSNLTYLLTDGRTRWVLRRPPLGYVLETAHDMGREHRLLAVLVRLHRLDPQQVGLGDLGRPEGYLERQLRRWTRQLEASHSRDLPELTRLTERLRAQLPISQGAAIVHGDYRLDNVVVDTGRGHILAVLDWEMATLGDPLADVASTLVWWDGVRGLDSPVAAVPAEVPGYPGRDHLLSAYGRQSDLDLTPLPWYVGFAFFKIAAIFEGIHFRAQQGLTVGEGFDRLGDMVPPLIERGHAALSGTT